LLGNHVNSPLLPPIEKVRKDGALQMCGIVFSQVALQHHSLHIVAIGPVTGVQVFFDADE
jgi:hypothetical protein